MPGLKNTIVPHTGWKVAMRTWVLPGFTLGLFLPLLFTRSIAYYPGLLLYSIPAGLLLLYGFFRGMLLVAKNSLPAEDAQERLAVILSPLMLLNFAGIVFIVPVPAIPFFLVAIALALVCYRTIVFLQSLCILPVARLECALFMVPFAACFFVLFQVNIIHDAFQYLATLVSVVKDFDLNFYNELYLQNAYRFYNPATLNSARYLGVPLLEVPFFAAGELLARVMALLGSYHAPNGMTFPYLFMVSLSSTFFGLGCRAAHLPFVPGIFLPQHQPAGNNRLLAGLAACLLYLLLERLAAPVQHLLYGAVSSLLETHPRRQDLERLDRARQYRRHTLPHPSDQCHSRPVPGVGDYSVPAVKKSCYPHHNHAAGGHAGSRPYIQPPAYHLEVHLRELVERALPGNR